MELNEIKSIRKTEIEILAASPLKRKLKKIAYLLKYGMPFGRFIKYSLSYLFVIPFAKIKTNLKSKAIRKEYFGSGTTDKKKGNEGAADNADACYIAVNIGNAGIGDAIVAIRFLRDLIDFVYGGQESRKNGGGVNVPIVFDIFYRSPDSIEFITSTQPNIRRVLNLPDYTLMRKFYDIGLKLNTFFIKEEINELSRDKISKKFPSILKIIGNIKTNQHPLEKYIKTRPFSEGILSDAVTVMGLSRATYLNNIAGIANNFDTVNIVASNNRKNIINGASLLNIDIEPAAVSKFNLQGVKFITVHDGWDENTKTKTGSATKSYPPRKWQELVSLLKHEFPDYAVVQLGGLGNGSDIEGIGLNLRGKTTLKEAASLLAASSLHIDADSGLLHIAVSLGTPCAVLFGPTNAEYCSYSLFANYTAVTPRLCGNCWWSSDGWMEACPRGLDAPECMYSIEPADVINAIKKADIIKRDTL